MPAKCNLMCAALAGLILMGAGPVAAATPQLQTSVQKVGQIPSYLPDVLLYDQTSNAAATSTSSQNFEAANNAFDNELADDFVVPAGGWAIDNVTVVGAYFNGPGPAASVHVAFYANSGSLPGAPVAGCDYPAVVPVDTAGSFSITLAPVCALAPGTYWVSVVANMDFTPNGQWGWTDRTVTSNNPAAWRNPGGGFALPACTGFAPRAATCGIGAGSPDQVFSLSGVTTPVELMRFSVE
jgi:hypothetical protein